MKNIIIRIVIIIGLILLIFAFGKRTYSALYSLIFGQTNIELAQFNVKLNDVDINSTYDININDIVWENEHANPLTLAPNSSGLINLALDVSNTDVALLYTISITDKTNDEDKLLTVTSLTIDGQEVVINSNQYSEIIPLSEVNDIKNIVITVSWLNDDENSDFDNLVGIDLEEKDLITIGFNVEQYNG